MEEMNGLPIWFRRRYRLVVVSWRLGWSSPRGTTTAFPGARSSAEFSPPETARRMTPAQIDSITELVIQEHNYTINNSQEDIELELFFRVVGRTDQ